MPRRPRTILAIVAILGLAALAVRLWLGGDDEAVGMWCFDTGNGALYRSAEERLPPFAAPSGPLAEDRPPLGGEAGVCAFVEEGGAEPRVQLLWTWDRRDHAAIAAYRSGGSASAPAPGGMRRWLRRPEGGAWLDEATPAGQALLMQALRRP